MSDHFQPVLYVLCICTAIDILTGVIKGSTQGVMESKKTFDGIKKKVVMFCLVLVSLVLEFVMGKAVPVGTIVTWSYVVMELESILENAVASGLPVPNILKKAVQNIAETHNVKTELEEKETHKNIPPK